MSFSCERAKGSAFVFLSSAVFSAFLTYKELAVSPVNRESLRIDYERNREVAITLCCCFGVSFKRIVGYLADHIDPDLTYANTFDEGKNPLLALGAKAFFDTFDTDDNLDDLTSGRLFIQNAVESIIKKTA